MLTGFDPNQIQDENARQTIIWLLNLVEELKRENGVLREEVQRLRDENNRLKGEQGQPDVKPNKAKKKQEHSSEKERHRSKKWRKGSKVDKIEIDREETLEVDKHQNRQCSLLEREILCPLNREKLSSLTASGL